MIQILGILKDSTFRPSSDESPVGLASWSAAQCMATYLELDPVNS